MTNLQMRESDLQILKNILSKFPYQFYAYGSRVKGVAKKYSDLDLCYKETIPITKLLEIEEAIENSDLPFFVEIVNWDDMRISFQENIKKDLVSL